MLQENDGCHKYISESRVDLANFERMQKETAGINTKIMLEETARLEKEFKRLCEIEQCIYSHSKPSSREHVLKTTDTTA